MSVLERECQNPTVVCLCGSTRFKQEFIAENFALTMQGKIVLSVGFFGHDPDQNYAPSENEKAMLDALHLRKIDLADEVLVINPGGYLGESTRREIAYAYSQGKPVRYLETLPRDHGMGGLYAKDWFDRDQGVV